ncbi:MULTISPECIES: peptide-methionine (S)-S-oxide reductase MsrA [Halomonadaceae]|jgi:peptide-methionine (S)-S-oxide reductase|uniref:Peptide methionine sulfoxide reductase MsrA n=1 Tax=Vreelandella piezotolerans TaxID=2609667 RepID=A0ABQ6X8I0_9GAMM|nr:MULTISPECIES: peptide-methionine (S)-S-oxide reductase MsrA [Halomonas]KAE8438326.1 peptide-methionine (S)-S-oxide reductase MsrA [Halomonas piezotolerans]MCG7591779.1 peptide-methionine (S)-S-oxide reductase MsrA [Halomonas sp. McD50-5]MCG7614926.1 peptide-methionine (S)-S-oxide reductase MsrA [Halomonas sp. McD50-4]QJA24185.1 peptide-methionine (S)-S-oxide reductase MsrA [Halomonas piezotolerans]TNH15983.1 peptide-methionine (S)-S-oxide reductase MsrA [Halomonas sp. BL6]|tara:strand:+ start:1313 stop:1930 length:618 start_codon:yes stop_codon:yes gene_type:complete
MTLLTKKSAPEGRHTPIETSDLHTITGHSIHPPYPEGHEEIVFGMGCFWGVERLFWQQPGVYVTAAGYAGGTTPNPTYKETCTGLTGHTEVVRVIFDPKQVPLETLLQIFWEQHDPTQGNRQGNDIGSQYRSAIFTTTDAQLAVARQSAEAFQQALTQAGKGTITTEIRPLDVFYYAEAYHQQYLDKNPGGYCGLKGTGVTCAIG